MHFVVDVSCKLLFKEREEHTFVAEKVGIYESETRPQLIEQGKVESMPPIGRLCM